MKVLIVKMSSLGDVIHTLPAITDARDHVSNIQFDWVVESSFQEIPKWHPNVSRVIPISLRRWRQAKWQAVKQKEIQLFIQQVRKENYDIILDAQGLIKSAVVARFAKGKRYGLHKACAREGLASLFYQHRIFANKKQHAVEKLRDLFAGVFGYEYEKGALNYGIDINKLSQVVLPQKPYVMFLHGTTWPTKHWPEQYWCELAKLVCQKGITVVLTWGNEIEKQRADKIKAYCLQQGLPTTPQVLPKLKLSEITFVIANAMAAVAVDTGLGHIAAMMKVPTLSLYGPTYPGFTGAYGLEQRHQVVDAKCHPCFEKNCPYAAKGEVYPPCFESLPPQTVWQELQLILKHKQNAVTEAGAYA